MPTMALTLAFASAIIHALWNVLLKRSRDLDTASAGVFLVAMVAAGGASLLVPGPAFPDTAGLALGPGGGILRGLLLHRAGALPGAGAAGLELQLDARQLHRAGLARVRAAAGRELPVVLPGLRGGVCAGLRAAGSASEGTKAPGALAWALFTGGLHRRFNLFYKLSLRHGAQPLALFSLSMAVGLPIQAACPHRRQGWASFRFLPERPGLVLAAGLLCTLGFSLFLVALSGTGSGAVTDHPEHLRGLCDGLLPGAGRASQSSAVAGRRVGDLGGGRARLELTNPVLSSWEDAGEGCAKLGAGGSRSGADDSSRLSACLRPCATDPHPCQGGTMFRRLDDFQASWKEESAKTLTIFNAIPDAALNTAVTPDHRDLRRLAWHLVESLIEMPGHCGLEAGRCRAHPGRLHRRTAHHHEGDRGRIRGGLRLPWRRPSVLGRTQTWKPRTSSTASTGSAASPCSCWSRTRPTTGAR